MVSHRVVIKHDDFQSHELNYGSRAEAEAAAHALVHHEHHVVTDGYIASEKRDSKRHLDQQVSKINKGEEGEMGSLRVQIYSPKG